MKRQRRLHMELNIQKQHLTPNPYSRPGLPLRSIKKIIVHWVANPATSAVANRNYFESLKQGTRGVYASSHYIIGLCGEIIECIPPTELAYHAKNANTYSLGIEVCHPDWEGKFSDLTYKTLIHFLAKLSMTYTLDPSTDILRHYDITGKVCPKYYVNHPAWWTLLKSDMVHILNDTYLKLDQPPQSSQVPKPRPISLQWNDKLKVVQAFLYQNNYYIRIRDLEDEYFMVSYKSYYSFT